MKKSKNRLLRCFLAMMLLMGMFLTDALATESDSWEGAWNSGSGEDYDLQVKITGTQCYQYAYEVIEKLNQLRSEKGVEPLEVDDKLMETAMRRAAECATFYDHMRPDGSSTFSIFPPESYKGENIAVGQRTPEKVMVSWENSLSHYDNMINDSFTSVGVGCFYVNDVYFWAQAFTDGPARPHDARGDTEKTETICMTRDLFFPKPNNPKIAASVGEMVEINFQLLNRGYRYQPIPFQPTGSVQCGRSDYIEPVKREPFTVRCERAGSGDLTVTIGNSEPVVFAFEIRENFADVSRESWCFDAVDWATKRDLIAPASSEHFDPDAPMTREMAAVLLYRLEGKPFTPGRYNFTDMLFDECADAAHWADVAGIMKGYGNDLFGPKDPLTREQMATVLLRYAQYKGQSTQTRNDLSAYTDRYEIGDYAVEAMGWANAEGYITGTTGTTLAPKKANTRAEAAMIFMRFCMSLGDDKSV